jgi:hypothetical protein
MWHDGAWRGRAGQAFVLDEPGVADGTTANSLAADRHGPPQDDQAVKTKLLTRGCLRILDQGLGPTRARSSRNRPLEKSCTRAGLAQGWAGHPVHSRRMPLTSQGMPEPDVDSPRPVTRSSNRNLCLSSDNWLLGSRSPPRDASAGRSRPWPGCCPRQTGRPIPGRVDSW